MHLEPIYPQISCNLPLNDPKRERLCISLTCRRKRSLRYPFRLTSVCPSRLQFFPCSSSFQITRQNTTHQCAVHCMQSNRLWRLCISSSGIDKVTHNPRYHVNSTMVFSLLYPSIAVTQETSFSCKDDSSFHTSIQSPGDVEFRTVAKRMELTACKINVHILLRGLFLRASSLGGYGRCQIPKMWKCIPSKP